MGIDLGLNHFRAIVAVADAGGFTAAAERLGLAQSSLSRAVHEVERRAGVRVFERTTRQVLLTSEGRELVALARHALDGVATSMNHFAGYLAGTRGSVTVATLPSLAATLLPGVVGAFHAHHPSVTLRIEDALSEEVTERVRCGAVDLAVTVPQGPVPGLRSGPLATDRFLVVVPPGHDLAGAASLRWADLAGHDMIAFDPTSSIRDHVERAMQATGTVPGQVMEARNVAAVAGLVAAGLGLSVVPALVLPLMQFAGLHPVLLEDPLVERSIRVLTDPRRPQATAVQAFVRALDERAAGGPPLPFGAAWSADDARVSGR
ncbi:LysR family transcriptional regulator [Pseudonocardia nigra]|uniref:LysR family transcriptional regulator n=1 Tax=Pseudonocardia nigra TaxID=1921578 RepID=UPI001C5E8D26|nr:LysR family transcriptional regulator [Pseudonocardia nigra]